MAPSELDDLDPRAAAADVDDPSPDEVLDLDLTLGIDDTPEVHHAVGGGGLGIANAASFGPPGKASAHGWRAVLVALKQKGMRENPSGSNTNPYSRYFGYGAQSWCADFVSWAFDSTGDRNRKVPWGYPSGVAGIVKWGRETGNLLSGPRPGAIFAYLNGQHTGLVVRLEGGKFLTVEGNTSGPDGAVTWVWTHARKDDGKYAFIQVPD